MLTLFSKFASIGVINTALHWLIFYLCIEFLTLNQAYSNVLAFVCAVSFSFFVNARYTFKSTTSWPRYISFTSFMGVLSFAVGATADTFQLPALLTLITFSAISLIIGFLFSHFFVFKDKPL